MMVQIQRIGRQRIVRLLTGMVLALSLATGLVGGAAVVQAQAASTNRQLGTVKTVSANKLTITTDAGVASTVNVVDDARVLQLSPGSTDLKTAKTIALGDIAPGDRVLVTGHADAPDAFTASRVILMKSTEIAHQNEAEQADWQARGSGGLVSAVDRSQGVITITSKARKIQVNTSSATIFRRYAGDSVKFQDSVLGNLGQIQVGDQLRVRGAKSNDGSSITAEEIVSGSFRNLAGTIVSIDLAADKVTLKDLATKKTYSVQLTANSSVRVLPPEAAARFATRAKGGGDGAGPPSGKSSAAVSEPAAGGGSSASAGAGAAGMDLSQMLSHLPQGSLKDLHPGDALMVVASQPLDGSISLTAITLLSGVEPILAATPSGSPSMTLSPWNMSGPDGGGA